ncbi:MAG TPA: Fe-S cluster assembly protein SufD [Gemmatimonadaceae bacterium]|nr:Fe-S cluster assembly protein SufD [Gemmatimonadaceae bacterium]
MTAHAETEITLDPPSAMSPFEEAFRTFDDGDGRSAPASIQSMREAAFEKFRRLGFPTTKNEDWHFTSVAPIVEHDYLYITSPSGDVQPAALAQFSFGRSDWHTLVFVNGRYTPELSNIDALPRGLKLLDLQTAWREAPVLVEQLAQITRYDDRAFSALNTAFMHDGAVVRVERGIEVEKPIHLVFVTDAVAAKSMMHPRNLIIIERHAKAMVIESYVSLSNAVYFTNAMTEVAVGEGATLHHYKMQREGLRAYHVGTIDTHQERDSHYVSFSLATGASLSRTNVYTTLDGEGCGSTLNGLYMLDGEQHCDHQTMIEHAQPNCYSRELYKGVLDGQSHGVFNGKVYVDPIAQKTDGKQTNNTLLLSDKAQIDTKPQLEIFADDVKCTHGATVGRLDEQALFYMKSRGVSRELARQLLTYAFAADVLETIEQQNVREELERMTLKRFTRIEGNG